METAFPISPASVQCDAPGGLGSFPCGNGNLLKRGRERSSPDIDGPLDWPRKGARHTAAAVGPQLPAGSWQLAEEGVCVCVCLAAQGYLGYPGPGNVCDYISDKTTQHRYPHSNLGRSSTTGNPPSLCLHRRASLRSPCPSLGRLPLSHPSNVAVAVAGTTASRKPIECRRIAVASLA